MSDGGDGEERTRLDRFLAPFRTEEAAFRVLLWVLALCVAIGVLVVVGRAIL